MAEFEKRLACVINADGTVARGYMIDHCEFDGVNAYVIKWKVPLQGEAKTNFAATIGSGMTEAVSPGLITVGLHQDPSRCRSTPTTPRASGNVARSISPASAISDGGSRLRAGEALGGFLGAAGLRPVPTAPPMSTRRASPILSKR